ncbi:phosphotransferase [Haloechinothrix sp. YIM 98757]|uniref:Phosphotransferase n=1 Tax=Haloechinothrix aidingensis TaxID=2752311 RepID=A0A838A952_9PSEU|nr:phosphotransferase [Haloechinothrix aidingensis]MBA0126008.1 phosphotransferase [Haloechinothrix aidingensis]
MSVHTSSAGDERAGNGAAADKLGAVVAAGESVLAQRFGAQITLIDPEDLHGSGPASVVRAKVDSSPFELPRTLVIKHYPEEFDEQLDPFATESASYQLFTALSPEDRVCPELIAHDGSRRVLVLEDLGVAPTLEARLAEHDSRTAERTLLSWARTLGRMHATTAGREPDFNALLRRLGAKNDQQGEALPVTCDRLTHLLREHLLVDTPDQVIKRVHRAAAWATSQEYRAFSPTDLSPENNLVTEDGVRFLDFEHGCMRNALIDVAHLRAPFAFWEGALALPPGMSEAMVAAWSAEVTGVWPGLDDHEALAEGLLDSQLICVWSQSVRVLPGLLEEPVPAGAQRPAAVRWCWQELANQAGRLGLAGIAEHAERVAQALDDRFGPGIELGLYPAFH